MNTRGAPAPARRRGRADRGADAADERPDRPRARRGAARERRGHAPGPARGRGRRARPQARSGDAACRLQLEPTIVAGVPARLERAVSNLIDNAVKYSPPGEPVEIELHGQGADGARPRTRDRRRGSAARVRPLLPRRRGARPARLGARAGDRAPGRRPAGRQRRGRARARRRDADAPAPARRRGRRGRLRPSCRQAGERALLARCEARAARKRAGDRP